jgi:drug/metabolite transporter (DMT)-like permease
VLARVPPLAVAGAAHPRRDSPLFRPRLRSGRWLPAARPAAARVLGLLGVTANQVLFILGLQRSTATNASILMLSIPVFTRGAGARARSSARRRAGSPALRAGGRRRPRAAPPRHG